MTSPKWFRFSSVNHRVIQENIKPILCYIGPTNMPQKNAQRCWNILAPLMGSKSKWFNMIFLKLNIYCNNCTSQNVSTFCFGIDVHTGQVESQWRGGLKYQLISSVSTQVNGMILTNFRMFNKLVQPPKTVLSLCSFSNTLYLFVFGIWV